jgi:H+/Cl- antiporter ClcA
VCPDWRWSRFCVLRLEDVDRRKLVICGIGAGFATVFGTPIAGALFGVEVLVLGQVMYEVLFPSFVAGIIGFHVATSLGVHYPHLAASITLPTTSWGFVEMILLGIWCGLYPKNGHSKPIHQNSALSYKKGSQDHLRKPFFALF